jgi:hypothetical protein
MSTEHTLLDLAANADIKVIEKVCHEVRQAAQRGDTISIHCDEVASVDLGALQLLQSLVEDVEEAELKFAAPPNGNILRGWLELVST